jgi:hypothetical protein
MTRVLGLLAGLAVLLCTAVPQSADSACCFFSAKGQPIIEPAETVFLTWDPQQKVESFTVQPEFEGHAPDFGMVVATPTQPKIEGMPKKFFEEMSVFTQLTHREHPISKLLPEKVLRRLTNVGALPRPGAKESSSITVVEEGVLGSLNYKIIAADKANELYTWLKDNKYDYAGDEATLDSYLKRKWFFTVLKIDAAKMKKRPDGSYSGEVTPLRFQFSSDQLVYPLKITRHSVRDKLDVTFYVQAPTKVDLTGDLTYQYLWIPMLQGAQGMYVRGTFGKHNMPGKGDDWLNATDRQSPALLQRAEQLGWEFVRGQQPEPNKQGRTPTIPEWAKRLTADDIRMLKGEAPYSEQMANVDEGYTPADVKEEAKAHAVYEVIHERLAKCRKERPSGYAIREAPEADVKQLKILAGYLKDGQFLTKFHKVFTKGEMDDDLVIVPAKLGQAEDESEYLERLPTTPP